MARVAPALREAHDLEIPEVLLLEYIGQSDLSPSEIAEAMKIPAHAISRKLDGLEKRGLIVRSLDPSDARRRVLELTPAGETLLKEAAALLEQQTADLLSVLSTDSLSTVLNAFDLVARSAPQPDTREFETRKPETQNLDAQEPEIKEIA